MGIAERRQREKEHRRKEIKDAARKVFLEKGYTSATINDIASVAQLSPATLYLYYKNKEELYTSLSVDMLRTLTRDVKEMTRNKTLSPVEKLSSLKDIYIKMYESDPKVLINLFHLQSADALTRLSPEVIEDIKEISSQSLKVMVETIQEGIDQGLLRDENPVAVGDMIWAIFTGVVLWVESKSLLDPRKNFVKKTLESALNIFYDGLKVK